MSGRRAFLNRVQMLCGAFEAAIERPSIISLAEGAAMCRPDFTPLLLLTDKLVANGEPLVTIIKDVAPGCKVVRYCCAECQKLDWKDKGGGGGGHKAVCSKLVEERTAQG